MSHIIVPAADQPLVEENLTTTQQTRTFMNAVARLSKLTGSGSPEGVVEAMAEREYMDTAGIAGSILYIKQVDSIARDTKLGWILV